MNSYKNFRIVMKTGDKHESMTDSHQFEQALFEAHSSRLIAIRDVNNRDYWLNYDEVESVVFWPAENRVTNTGE